MAPRRNKALALPCLGGAALACWGLSSAFSAPSLGRPAEAHKPTAQALGGRLTQPRTRLAARGGEAEADSIEVSGFAGFIVGLALLPHVVYTLTILFDVSVNGAALSWGPYALNAISPVISLGVVLWSLGSYIERGCGLPAGPLALMGITEGLSYIAFLGATVAFLVVGIRPGGVNLSVPLPAAPTISAPSFKAPELNVPKLQAPEFKAPEVKLPEVKAPSIKVPEVKLPEKTPAKKEPEKKAPAKKEPEKKEVPPAVKAPAKPAMPAASAPDYDSLFD